MTRRVAWIIGWIVVVAAAGFMRLDDLADRPFHADEATGARITARRMESGGANFDPRHYHGPLLADLTMPLCRMRGENGWLEMTKKTPRLVCAIAGILLVLLPLAGVRRFGHAPMLAAAALLATSPLLVYYSRMFIHEPLLVLFGMAAMFSLAGGSRWGGAGFLTGLMFAVKETFAISMIAWSAAAVVLVLETWLNKGRDSSPQRSGEWSGNETAHAKLRNPGMPGHSPHILTDRPEVGPCQRIWREYRRPLLFSLGAFLATWIFIYTDAFRHPRGLIDSIRTFFVYRTGVGHEKPFVYYLQLLAWPEKSAGRWWFGTPVLLLALAAYAATFLRNEIPENTRRAIRFLAYSAAGHFLIYSLFIYKTPWLACLPWAQVCLLAGFSVCLISRNNIPALAVAGVMLAGTLFTQYKQARMASGRLSSDARNPFAYVPTQRNVERLAEWLEELEHTLPAGSLEPTLVIGREYWPLPWYLRGMKKTGWLAEAPPDVANMPLVFAMPEPAAILNEQLAATHTALPRGLRAEVPLMMYLRNDLWELWMNSDD